MVTTKVRLCVTFFYMVTEQLQQNVTNLVVKYRVFNKYIRVGGAHHSWPTANLGEGKLCFKTSTALWQDTLIGKARRQKTWENSRVGVPKIVLRRLCSQIVSALSFGSTSDAEKGIRCVGCSLSSISTLPRPATYALESIQPSRRRSMISQDRWMLMMNNET